MEEYWEDRIKDYDETPEGKITGCLDKVITCFGIGFVIMFLVTCC